MYFKWNLWWYNLDIFKFEIIKEVYYMKSDIQIAQEAKMEPNNKDCGKS